MIIFICKTFSVIIVTKAIIKWDNYEEYILIKDFIKNKLRI